MTRYKARCRLGEKCECGFTSLRVFCEHLNAERPEEEVHAQNREAWMTLPAELRNKAREHLAERLSNEPAFVSKLTDQAKRGVALGSDNIRFHFAEGMAIRNALRGAVRDAELPRGTTWDDYYYGALSSLFEDVAA